ncbi:hypothetical protein PRUPE_1G120400 [Prunus persica]|uniref:Uncharacterized protein n=1 Tax=Prunus persica TaxID=3760 RepID=A0A251QW56_PRUPE|nr:hypothetical protein PRUPE_1G120400 [Prunus persica]
MSTGFLILKPKIGDNKKASEDAKVNIEQENNSSSNPATGSKSCATSRNNICQNEITATNGATDVGVSNFDNYAVEGQGGSEGTKGFPERGGGYNIFCNKISADGARDVGIRNFGNTTHGMPFTTEEDHGEEAEGRSSSPKPQEGPTS